LKLLELAEDYYPGKLQGYFNERIFVYANVPYRIKGYDQLLENPKDTIDFDHSTDEKIAERWTKLGADAALLTDIKGNIHEVTFTEKILATLLAKMSNFIPEAGIWMNTQRPEWNDANNALVGNGVSMVTLYYLIRFLKFMDRLYSGTEQEYADISTELYEFLNAVTDVLERNKDLLEGPISDKDRKTILDGLGKSGSEYRSKVYSNSFTGTRERIHINEIKNLSGLCLAYAEHTLKANRRPDHLYHAYNLMTVKGSDEVEVSHLDVMLEGQVAVLSSGHLPASETLTLLDALRNSALYRKDQNSYLLYPEKELPGFLDRNNIPSSEIAKLNLLTKLIEDGNTQIIEQDDKGGYHFNGSFNNARFLKKALDQLSDGPYDDLVNTEKSLVLSIYEGVFNHKAFTGRSGTFYGYEGLGSIYWHMVSKLLLAVQECCLDAIQNGADDEITNPLIEHYYEINEGIGVHKPPSLYGAYPTDPYSHTPKNKGAQQPGMTGQVKEDLLCRLGELGVNVVEGKLSLQPSILKKSEFLSESKTFTYVDYQSKWQEMELEKNSIAFTCCQVPIVYKISDEERITVTWKDGSEREIEGLTLGLSESLKVYQRNGEIRQITVQLQQGRLI
jgi:hypothetical protein